MLGKLLKYEFKSTARIFLPFYASIIVLSILNRILFIVLDNVEFLGIPKFLTMTTYVLFIIATFVMTLIVIIQRFYKNLLGEEGYLSMTLPVKTSTHIFCKITAAFTWVISTVLTTIISIILVLPDFEVFDIIGQFWRVNKVSFETATNMNFTLMFVLGCAFILISIISSILMIYTAICFGQLSNKHKVLTSFGSYVAIYTILQAVNLVMISILGSSFDIFSNSELPANIVPGFLIGGLCLQIAYVIAFFFTTRHILDKKLNLQ